METLDRCGRERSTHRSTQINYLGCPQTSGNSKWTMTTPASRKDPKMQQLGQGNPKQSIDEILANIASRKVLLHAIVLRFSCLFAFDFVRFN